MINREKPILIEHPCPFKAGDPVQFQGFTATGQPAESRQATFVGQSGASATIRYPGQTAVQWVPLARLVALIMLLVMLAGCQLPEAAPPTQAELLKRELTQAIAGDVYSYRDAMRRVTCYILDRPGFGGIDCVADAETESRP